MPKHTDERPRAGWCFPCVDWIDVGRRKSRKRARVSTTEEFMNMLLIEAAQLEPPESLPLYEYRAQFAGFDPCGRRAGFRYLRTVSVTGRWERLTRGPDRPDFLVHQGDDVPPLAVESKINNSIQADQLRRYRERVDRG